MKTYAVALLCLLSAYILVEESATQQSPETGFINFLNQSLQNYTNWAVWKGLEPLFVPQPVNISIATSTLSFSGEVWNQTIHGLSRFDPARTNIASSVLGGNFSINTYSAVGVRVEGPYEIEGAIGPIPIEGLGLFQTNPSNRNIQVSYISFGVSGFQIVNDRVNITNARISPGSPRWSSLQLQFEGLRAGGFEDDVVLQALNKYSSESQTTLLRPATHENLLRYFTELFATVPFSQIIKTE